MFCDSDIANSDVKQLERDLSRVVIKEALHWIAFFVKIETFTVECWGYIYESIKIHIEKKRQKNTLQEMKALGVLEH